MVRGRNQINLTGFSFDEILILSDECINFEMFTFQLETAVNLLNHPKMWSCFLRLISLNLQILLHMNCGHLSLLSLSSWIISPCVIAILSLSLSCLFRSPTLSCVSLHWVRWRKSSLIHGLQMIECTLRQSCDGREREREVTSYFAGAL